MEMIKDIKYLVEFLTPRQTACFQALGLSGFIINKSNLKKLVEFEIDLTIIMKEFLPQEIYDAYVRDEMSLWEQYLNQTFDIREKYLNNKKINWSKYKKELFPFLKKYSQNEHKLQINTILNALK